MTELNAQGVVYEVLDDDLKKIMLKSQTSVTVLLTIQLIREIKKGKVK